MEHIRIWERCIPGNSNRKKLEVMELKKKRKMNLVMTTIHWIMAVKAGPFKDEKKTIDTYTDTCVKATDPAYGETFEDIPYLIPFPAKDSKRAVIVVPGGGYCMKEMEGEGTKIAEQLQKCGITAFVLWYRSNPYYQPYPLMDMQRAVRYVRYHAKDYGYDADQIGAVGFSAGGGQVSLFMNVLRGGRITLPDYEKDAVDDVDDALNFAALVYPALGYEMNPTMMFASFPAEDVRDEKRREILMEQYDAIRHMNSGNIPQFICYGTKDQMISVAKIKEYIQALKHAGASVTEVPVEGADHGYGDGAGTEYGFWLKEYIEWVQSQNN